MRKARPRAVLAVLAAALTPGTGAAQPSQGPVIFRAEPCKTELVCITWTKPSSIEIESIGALVYEGAGAEKLIGQFDISSKASRWESVQRKTFPLTRALGIDIRHPEQWGNAAVLTPGHHFVMRFTVSYREVDTQRSRATVETVRIDQLANLQGPNRPAFVGDFNLVLFCFLFLLALLFGSILLWLVRTGSRIASPVFRTLRRDTNVKQEVLSLANNQDADFWDLYFYLLATQLVAKFALPAITNISLTDKDVALLGEVLQAMGRMRVKDWPADRRDIVRIAEPPE
jgi:hypothetical protein